MKTGSALLATLLATSVSTGAAARDTFAGYLGQAPPGQTPRVFSLQTHDGYYASDRIAISADGKELYYTEVTSTWSDYNIRHYSFANGKWNGPFDLFPGFLGPALSVDNTTMTFEKYNDARTCWHSTRTNTGWSTPTPCTEVPDPTDKHYLRDTSSGRIYASSRGALDGIGQMDISTHAKADAQGAWRSLGKPLNSPGNEGDFYVARDEAFIVFGSPHRGGVGGGDLFISVRKDDGSWSDPKNLGTTVNTPGFEFGPYVTDDKRFLFFSRSSDFTRVDVYWVLFDDLLETAPEARPYLGQNPPGTTPVIFAPGVVSTGNIHSRLEISPDGQEMFWNTVDMKTFSTQILSVKNINGAWSAPQPPPFAREGNTQGAVFSPDGKRLFFSVDTGGGWARKYVEKTETGWSAARADGFLPNGSSSFTRSGRAYFSGEMKTKIWNTGIFGARYAADGYADVTPLGDAINRPNAIDYTPYVSPDESFLLFSSNRPLNGDKEDMFIHVSFRKQRWHVVGPATGSVRSRPGFPRSRRTDDTCSFAGTMGTSTGPTRRSSTHSGPRRRSIVKRPHGALPTSASRAGTPSGARRSRRTA